MNKLWHKLCNDNSLWQRKCSEVHLGDEHIISFIAVFTAKYFYYLPWLVYSVTSLLTSSGHWWIKNYAFGLCSLPDWLVSTHRVTHYAVSSSVLLLLASDVPVYAKPGHDPDWKQLYKENLSLKLNWQHGNCDVIDCKGHKDRLKTVFCISVFGRPHLYNVTSRCTQHRRPEQLLCIDLKLP